MKRYLKRMILALIISASGFFGTVIWFESGKGDGHGAGARTPVARLDETTNDVQRKPLRRVIWETVSKNDDLYPGEAIRTSANAEAKIELTKSGTIIHLEPDSLVVLEENDKGLSLDFLQGNLFVQSTGAGTGADDLTLKTGSGEIKLKSADMSLSRDQSGKVNLEVHKGQAELDQGGKKTSLDKDRSAQLSANGVSVAKDGLHILSPQAGDTVLLNLMRGEKLEMTFKPIPAGYRVSAEIGVTRSNLKPAGEPVAGETGKTGFPGKSGKWFVRLVAESEDPKLPKLISTYLPITVAPKSPPALVEPGADRPMIRDNAQAPVIFRWLNRHSFQSQILEIAGDAGFKNIKIKQTLKTDDLSFQTPLADGEYFWRVTGFLKIKDKVEGLTSPPFKLSLQSNVETKPPVLTWPTNQQRLSYLDAQKSGLSFKWSQPAGVELFHIVVEMQGEKSWTKILDQDLSATSTKIGDLKPGEYRWKVSSVDRKTKEQKSSTVFTYSIEDVPKMEWAEAPTDYEYPGVTPVLRAAWKPLAQPPARYRYRVTAKGSKPADSQWQHTKQNVFDMPLPVDGAYEAEVQALGARDQVIAQSDPKAFNVRRRPLLPAPQWTQSTPEKIKTDAKGNVSLGWNDVDGAKNYLMILEGDDGKVLEQRSVSRNTASLNRLKPGQYKVKLKAIDGFQRPSEASPAKNLEVPSVSDIQAPKIKNMKVK